jgi:hypothetical protein
MQTDPQKSCDAAGYEPDDGPLSANQLKSIQQKAAEQLPTGQALSWASVFDADSHGDAPVEQLKCMFGAQRWRCQSSR